ncbi:MAG: ABC transporter ATP-binding protein [Marivirga sp.]|nr:ABC transporter ATP-binding protein [Marivirga sp.]
MDIHVDKLGKKFNREWIFRDLSYSFKADEVYAITGPNGSGKSTLLQVLWGQMPQSIGALKYIAKEKEIPADEIFTHVSIAAPYMDLIEEFTLGEQLRFHFSLKPPRTGMSETEMLERMYLTHAKDKYISNFSSGMKQRVKLALAFFSHADILFLDEPGTNLDSQAFDWYLQQLGDLLGKCLIFIASNQTSEYPSNAQKIDIMSFK